MRKNESIAERRISPAIPERNKALKQPDPERPGRRLVARMAILLLTVGSILLLYTFRASTMTGDSLNYAYSIRAGSGLFHPHHLLFNPIVRGLLIILIQFCRSCEVILAAQVHNIFWAGVALCAVFIMIRHLTSSAAWGAAAFISLLATKGFWAYSTQVQVYIPALGCLAVMTAILMRREKSASFLTGPVFMSLLFSLSIFYHQSSILFAIPLAYIFAVGKNRLGRKSFPLFFALSGTIVLAAYVLAFLSTAGRKTPGAFVIFCLSYVFHPNPDWATLKNLSFKGIGHLMLSQARVVAPFSSAWYIPAAVVAALGLGTLSAWHIRQILKKSDKAELRLFSLLWLLTIYLFLLWYAPGAYELLIVALLPIELLIFLAVRDVWPALKISPRRVLAGTGAAAILALGGANFFLAIRPAHVSKGPDFDEARILNMWVPTESVILSNWYIQQHLRYYFQRENALEVDIPFFCFYRRLALPQGYATDSRAGLVVSPSYLYPETEISKAVKLNGYRYPSEWLRWMGWVFMFEYDSQGRLASCRSFEAVNLGSGYLSLSPARMNVDGLEDLLGKLDAQIQRRLADPVPHFLNWFHKNPGVRPNSYSNNE